MAHQAKCKECRIRYLFADATRAVQRQRISTFNCPVCGTVLEPTTHQSAFVKVSLLWAEGFLRHTDMTRQAFLRFVRSEPLHIRVPGVDGRECGCSECVFSIPAPVSE